jgi:hypothetical protein
MGGICQLPMTIWLSWQTRWRPQSNATFSRQIERCCGCKCVNNQRPPDTYYVVGICQLTSSNNCLMEVWEQLPAVVGQVLGRVHSYSCGPFNTARSCDLSCAGARRAGLSYLFAQCRPNIHVSRLFIQRVDAVFAAAWDMSRLQLASSAGGQGTLVVLFLGRICGNVTPSVQSPSSTGRGHISGSSASNRTQCKPDGPNVRVHSR